MVCAKRLVALIATPVMCDVAFLQGTGVGNAKPRLMSRPTLIVEMPLMLARKESGLVAPCVSIE